MIATREWKLPDKSRTLVSGGPLKNRPAGGRDGWSFSRMVLVRKPGSGSDSLEAFLRQIINDFSLRISQFLGDFQDDFDYLVPLGFIAERGKPISLKS
jgi:hypothetical protein